MVPSSKTNRDLRLMETPFILPKIVRSPPLLSSEILLPSGVFSIQPIPRQPGQDAGQRDSISEADSLVWRQFQLAEAADLLGDRFFGRQPFHGTGAVEAIAIGNPIQNELRVLRFGNRPAVAKDK